MDTRPQLPDYVQERKRTVSDWIEPLQHPEGEGRYRVALDAFEPYSMYATWTALRIREFVHGEDWLTEEQRREWAEYLRDHQREHGLFRDERLERHLLHNYESDEHVRWMERHGFDNSHTRYMRGRSIYYITWTDFTLGLLDSLGGEPKYELPDRLPESARVEDDHDPWEAPPEKFLYDDGEEMRAYLNRLDWSDPWGAGQWAGLAVARHRHAETFDDRDVDEVVEAAVDWFLDAQDPDTGAWSEGSDPPIHARINGIFKMWHAMIGEPGFSVQYPRAVIDLCLDGLREDPRLAGTPDSLCIWDAAFVLNVALSQTDYRRKEVSAAAAEKLAALEAMSRSDGAFSYTPHGSTGIFGPFKLAPAKVQSDVGGTVIVLSAVAELCDLCGLRNEWEWLVPSDEHRKRAQ
jgi:hypothetical protein